MVHQRSIGLPPGTPWDALVAAELPEAPREFNIASACVDEQPAGDLALVTEDETGERRFTFGDLANRSARLAAGLKQLGVMREERIAVVLPNRWETIVAVLAAVRIGAIAVLIDAELGPDALALRLNDSAPRIAVVDDQTIQTVRAAARVETIHIREGRSSVQALIAFHQPAAAVTIPASHPALLFYEGLAAGPPAGVLLAHRTLLGWLPSMELAWGWFPQHDDVAWTPSPWTTPAGLLGTLLPALYHGSPTIGWLGSADPADDIERLRRHGVTCMTVPPRYLQTLVAAGIDRSGVPLRSIAVLGPAGEQLHEWATTTGGVSLNEISTSCTAGPCVGMAVPSWPTEPDGTGRPYPGFVTEVVDEGGAPLEPGTLGHLAVRSDHPAAMLEYWRRPRLTAVATRDEWLLTGRMAIRADDGAIRLRGVPGIVDLGDHLVGSWEIERCLESDAEVARAAVVAVPDTSAGEAIKAYVVARDRSKATPETAVRLATKCGERLAPHLAPKRISFVSDLPLDAHGEVDHSRLTGS